MTRFKGQILVETIIGVGVVGLVLSGIIPLFLVGIKGAPEALKQDTAWMLANEMADSVNALSNENWNNIYRLQKGSHYRTVLNQDTWAISEGDETISLNNNEFTRYFTVDNVSRTGINGLGNIETQYETSRDDPSTQKLTIQIAWAGSAGLNLEKYLTRHANSTWVQTNWTGVGALPTGFTSTTDNHSSPSNSDIDIANQQLKLSLEPGGEGQPYGNKMVYASVGAATISSSANQQRYSMRFTAQKTGNVNQLRFYIGNQRQGNRLTIRYGIQGNDLNGNPDGSWMTSATANFAATGWQTVDITPANLSSGTVYHFVAQYVSHTGNPSIGIRYGMPINNFVPKTMTADAALNTFSFLNNAWTLQNQTPIYVLKYDDNETTGNPYENYTELGIRGGTTEGETFTVSDPQTVTGAALYVRSRANSLPPDDDLYMSLTDLTDSTDLITGEVLVSRDTITNDFEWYTASFSESIDLVANHQYRLYFSSPGVGNATRYETRNLISPVGNVEYNDITWNGTDDFSSSNSADRPEADLAGYLVLNGGMRYVADGELTSATFDTGNTSGAGLNRIAFFRADAWPEATARVKIQIAANNDNLTWNYLGPEGVGGLNDWYDLALGENIYFGQSQAEARYLRYKIRLETSDQQTATPIVEWIRVNYSM